jgi:hypothetical protein
LIDVKTFGLSLYYKGIVGVVKYIYELPRPTLDYLFLKFTV